MNFLRGWVAAALLAGSIVSLHGQNQIAAGAGHGAVLKSDGTVWTWGANAYGQLGRGADDSWAPALVPGLSGIQSVAAGDEFTMALKADGTVWTWGQNEEGQLGTGSKTDSPRPAVVVGLPRIVGIAAARKHAMALDSNGTVWGWGSVPNRNPELRPLQVTNLTNVMAIAAGDDHSVALDGKGQAWVWGDHGAGQLADHCFISYYPQLVPGMTDMTAIAGGYQLTVALKKDGTVWSIGYGEAGQHGDGTTQSTTKPVMVRGLSGVKAIAARYMNVMALKGDGTVWGWGSNHFRQLGNPAFSSEDAAKPVRVSTLTGVLAIAAGPSYASALNSHGVWLFGQNNRGSLGADPGTLQQADAPMQPGQGTVGECRVLFGCLTGSGKMIRICGEQDLSQVDKWSHINYRFGPVSGPPELMFPADPENAPPSLFFSVENRNHESLNVVRFSNGAYTYRVYYGEGVGSGVEVMDAKGKKVSGIACAERPEVYSDYLQMNLPCDPKNPAGCKKATGR